MFVDDHKPVYSRFPYGIEDRIEPVVHSTCIDAGEIL